MSGVTQILASIERGDPHAAEQLLPLVYDELRELAAASLAQENPGQTLQATALVHEAWLRLVTPEQSQRWDSRGHFFAAAAESMRRILVDNARRKNRVKRGGGGRREPLDDVAISLPDVREDLISLDQALTRLAAIDRQSAELIQLRYFAGLTVPEAAQILNVSPRTADRMWAYARAWLHREIEGASPPGETASPGDR